MSIQNALLVELSREKDNTLRIIQALAGADFSYKPHPKSMSLGELANHVVEMHGWVAYALEKDVFDFHTDYTPSTLTSAEDLEARLLKEYEYNKQLIETLNEADYFSNWTLKAGEHIIAEMPKAGVIRFMVTNHLIHHRGQLTVYMRMLDIKLPGIYGPTADDKQ